MGQPMNDGDPRCSVRIDIARLGEVRPADRSIVTGGREADEIRLGFFVGRRKLAIAVTLDRESLKALRDFQRLLIAALVVATLAVVVCVSIAIGGLGAFIAGKAGQDGWSRVSMLFVVISLITVVISHQRRPPFYPERVSGRQQIRMRHLSRVGVDNWQERNPGLIHIDQ